MDQLDWKLLNLVQADSARTTDSLAEEVPLSPSAITRRLKRMRENGIIVREVAVVSPALREKRVTAILTIQLDRHTPAEWAKLKRVLISAPEVQVCMEITGSADVLVIASTRDVAHFNDFADSIGCHPLVRRYESIFCKREVKMSLAVEFSED